MDGEREMARMFTPDEVSDLIAPALEFKDRAEDLGYCADMLLDYYPNFIKLIHKMTEAKTQGQMDDILEDIEYLLSDARG